MMHAIFGGSFDPVHAGHLYVMHEVRRHISCNQFIVVPSGRNPLKADGPVAAAHHRVAMLRIALASVERCTISTVETDRTGPSYMVETLDALEAAGTVGRRPGFIMGEDLVAELPRWHRWKNLLERVIPVVITREGGTAADPAAPGPPAPRKATILPEETVYLKVPPHGASSREVRRRCAARLPLEDLLPRGVEDYIHEHHLYR